MSDQSNRTDIDSETLGCGLVLLCFFLLFVITQAFETLRHLIDAGWRP